MCILCIHLYSCDNRIPIDGEKEFLTNFPCGKVKISLSSTTKMTLSISQTFTLTKSLILYPNNIEMINNRTSKKTRLYGVWLNKDASNIKDKDSIIINDGDILVCKLAFYEGETIVPIMRKDELTIKINEYAYCDDHFIKIPNFTFTFN